MGLQQVFQEGKTQQNEKIEKERKRQPGLLLGVVEGKVYYRYVGQNSQRRTSGESRVDMTRLSCTMWGEGRGKRGEPGAVARRPKGTMRT